MKIRLKKILGKRVYNKLSNFKKKYLDNYGIKIYSQDGEDVILNQFFLDDKLNKGFYVDVGAHHPKRFSNTYMFYKKGWNGINIDAMPRSMILFNKLRKGDTNLELGISEKKGNLLYYMFNESALNGFSKELSEIRNNNSKIISKREIKTYPLSCVLDKYLIKGQRIDFMSIDVEGLDLEVLRSNNWEKYKPTYLLIEIMANKIEDLFKNQTYIYLRKLGYSLVAKTFRTCIFKINLK